MRQFTVEILLFFFTFESKKKLEQKVCKFCASKHIHCGYFSCFIQKLILAHTTSRGNLWYDARIFYGKKKYKYILLEMHCQLCTQNSASLYWFQMQFQFTVTLDCSKIWCETLNETRSKNNGWTKWWIKAHINWSIVCFQKLHNR